jgi:hypothetical protein
VYAAKLRACLQTTSGLANLEHIIMGTPRPFSGSAKVHNMQIARLTLAVLCSADKTTTTTTTCSLDNPTLPPLTHLPQCSETQGGLVF